MCCSAFLIKWFMNVKLKRLTKTQTDRHNCVSRNEISTIVNHIFKFDFKLLLNFKFALLGILNEPAAVVYIFVSPYALY